jgi:hypothetical protein
MRLADGFSIKQLVRDRLDQPGFHVSSQEHVRIEFHNYKAEQTHSFRYGGNVVLTCYRGAFRLILEDGQDHKQEGQELTELDQVVVTPHTKITLRCKQAGTVQIIWTPPFASASSE